MESAIGHVRPRVVGLSMRDFTTEQVLHALGWCLTCLLGFSSLHFLIWKKTRSRTLRSFATMAIIAAWGCAYHYGQPRHPYWVHEFAVMAYSVSIWHLVDWVFYRVHESIPAHVGIHHLLIDEALVLRPFLLRHKVGGRQHTGRTWQQRCVDALPFVWAFTQNYIGCEALNAFLMRQSADDVLHGPFVFRMISTFAFGMTLYYHLGYFYYLLATLSVLLLDHVPEDWPPAFDKPWTAANPTEFWNERWHAMFKHWFTRLVFKPTRDLMYWLLTHKPALTGHAAPHACPAVETEQSYMHMAAPAGSNATSMLPQLQQQQQEDVLFDEPPTGLRRRHRAAHVPAVATTCSDPGRHSKTPSQDNESVEGGSSSSTLCSSDQDLCVDPHLEQDSTELQDAQQADEGVGRDEMQHALSGDAYAVITGINGNGMKGSNDTAGAGVPVVDDQGADAVPAATVAGADGVDRTNASVTGGASSSTFLSQALRSGRGVPRSPLAKLLIQAVPVMAVFAWSGLFHELLLKAFFGAATGEQFLFFMLHGVACLVHRMWQGDVKQQQQRQHSCASRQRSARGWLKRRQLPRWLGVALFNLFCCATAMMWFIKPWFRFEYHKELRVPVPGPVNHAVNYLLDQLSILLPYQF